MHVPVNQERIKGCLLYLGGSSYFTFSLRSNVQHSVCVLQDVRRSLCLCWRWRPPLSGLEQKEVCPPKCPWQPWNEPFLLASRRPRKGKGSVVAPGVGIRTDLRGEHRMRRAHTNSMLAAHIRTLSTDVCIALSVETGKKLCHQSELICMTSSSMMECETTSQVCLYLSVFIKTACLSVLWVYSCDKCIL